MTGGSHFGAAIFDTRRMTLAAPLASTWLPPHPQPPPCPKFFTPTHPHATITGRLARLKHNHKMAKKDPVLSSDDVLDLGAIENGSTSRWYRVPRRWYLVKDRTGNVFGFWAVLEHAHGDRFGDFHRETRRRAASNKVSRFFWQ